MALFVSFWLSLTPSGSLWLAVRLTLALSGSLWLSLAHSGSLWLSHALFGSLLLSEFAHKALAWLVASVLHYNTLISPDKILYVMDVLTVKCQVPLDKWSVSFPLCQSFSKTHPTLYPKNYLLL